VVVRDSTSRRLRVAQVGNFDPDSADGTDKVVVGLASWLPRHGVETEVWQLTQTHGRSQDLELNGVQVANRPALPRPLSYLSGLSHSAQTFVHQRQSAVDLVHFHSALVPEHVAAAERLHVPYVISPQGGYSPGILNGRHRWFKAPWMRFREGPYVRKAAFLHSVSAREEDGLRSAFPDVPIKLIPAAVDAPPLPDASQRRGRDLTPKDLVYLGRMVISQKGLDLLLHGYADFVARTADQQTRLVLIGPDFQGGLAQLRALAHTLGIADRVVFREPVYSHDKWACLSNAYAFVHPSRWEGLPNAVMEAMAASCPVLVTPGTNISELVTDYAAGIAVDYAPGALSTGLEAIVGLSPERYVHMGQRARQLVDDHFSWSVTADRLARAYAAVCQGRARRDQEPHRPPTARP
jgi:poly(glycerol-phosphate) alpha-glucosyltransferase